jgi:hypothetical protein
METQRTTSNDSWTYGDQATLGTDVTSGVDLVGYGVEAVDGGIGKIDEATYEAGSSYIVVDTGPWIFGKKVMLPASVVNRVDVNDETVFVSRTKDEIKDAPEFDEDRYREQGYRDELGGYYESRSDTRSDDAL